MVNNFRVRLNITNYPVVLWSPKFIKQAVADFGEVESIDEQNLVGNDRSSLNLWIECVDPKRIPTSKVLPLGDRWTRCYINIVGWKYNEWVPPEARMTEEDEHGRTVQIDGDFKMARFTLKIANDRIRFYLSGKEGGLPFPPTNPSDSAEPGMTGNERGTAERGDADMGMAHHLWGTLPAQQVGPRGILGSGPGTRKKDVKQIDKPNGQQTGGDRGKEGHTKVQTEKSPNTDFCHHAKKEVLQVGEFSILTDAYVWQQRDLKTKEAGDKQGMREPFTVKVGEVTIIYKALVLTNLTGQDMQGQGKDCNPQLCLRSDMSQQQNGKEQAFLKEPIQVQLHQFGESRIKDEEKEASKGLQPINAPLTPSTINPTAIQNPKHTPIIPNTHHQQKFHTATQTQLTPTMDRNDEEFLARFAKLSAEAGPSEPFNISEEETHARDWSSCALARVVSDRTVQEAGFISTMMKAWGTHSNTQITALARNIFLVQFANPNELTRVAARGLWTYRADAVVLRRVHGQEELTAPAVKQMEVVAQFHRIPPQSITDEGLLKLVKNIGTPLSEVSHAFYAGNKYNRIKLLMPVDKPLIGVLPVNHPTLGVLPIYVSYERLHRVCSFCAMLGHEADGCQDKVQMDRIKRDPKYENRPDILNATKPIAVPWLLNPALIPSETPDSEHTEPHSTQPPQAQPNRTDQPCMGLGMHPYEPQPHTTNQTRTRTTNRHREGAQTGAYPGHKRAGHSTEPLSGPSTSSIGETMEGEGIPVSKRRAVEAPIDSASLPER